MGVVLLLSLFRSSSYITKPILKQERDQSLELVTQLVFACRETKILGFCFTFFVLVTLVLMLPYHASSCTYMGVLALYAFICWCPGHCLESNFSNDVDSVSPVINSGDGIDLPQKVLFPPERLHLKWSQPQRIGAGLQNMGNTCFLNSALQCLTYTPPFANYMLTREHSKTCKLVSTSVMVLLCMCHCAVVSIPVVINVCYLFSCLN